MKILAYIIFIALIMGCSQKNTNMCTETERYWTNVYGIKHLNSTLKKYNYRYKIASIDTRNWTKNKKNILKIRKVIEKFGKKLGKKAIIGNLIDKTSRKRAYIHKVQKQLHTSYNLDTQAPFFILYKKGSRRGTYVPYKIISISSISLQSLERDLMLLSKAINSGRSKKSIYASLNRIKKEKYASNRSMFREVLVEALESTVEGCK